MTCPGGMADGGDTSFSDGFNFFTGLTPGVAASWNKINCQQDVSTIQISNLQLNQRCPEEGESPGDTTVAQVQLTTRMYYLKH